MSRVKEMLYQLRCVVTGRGGKFLLHKKEVHRRRGIAERRVLEEAAVDPTLFRQNQCPACGERHLPREEFANPIGYQFGICPKDGTVYMDPIPTDATLTRMYNDPAESYLWMSDEAVENVDVKPSNQEDYQAVLRSVPNIHPGMRLLDIGCATGSFLLTASPTFDVEGCELNGSTADVARAHGLRVHTGSIQDFPGSELFDVITMLQVIEHLPTPEATLREVWRLLKPGGCLFVNTPNIDSASFKALRNRHIHVSSFGHVSLFNRESLLLLGKRCGFEVVAHEFCNGSDLSTHDWLSFRFFNKRFSHRMALYSPRFYYACELLDRATFAKLPTMLFPAGHESYHWAMFCKPHSAESARSLSSSISQSE
jgi:2-polyprenyl-3-methyl-5-hydroxy-6-metoxy-1,4-benzoquinol methylase